jgi:hypothetical protein
MVLQLRASTKHRAINLQACEYGEFGAVRVTGFLQLSAVDLVDLADTENKIIKVKSQPGNGSTLCVEISDANCESNSADFIEIASAVPTTKIIGTSTCTRTYPVQKAMDSNQLRQLMHTTNAVDIIIRPSHFTVVALVKNNVKGALWECIQNQRRRRNAIGSNHTSRSRPLKITTKTKTTATHTKD